MRDLQSEWGEGEALIDVGGDAAKMEDSEGTL